MTNPGNNNSKLVKVFIGLFVVFILGASGTAYYFWKKAKQDVIVVDHTNPEKTEVDQLVAQVSKLLLLPEGETPTVATVSNPESLRGQSFFAHAKIGDKVLIYTKARKVILYDPIHNRIIDIAPLNPGGSPQP